MSDLPKNLPTLLRKAGLEVIEIDGWENRGRPASTGSFAPVGVLNHHTGGTGKADAARELAYAQWMFLTGRNDLPAPLCNIGLGYTGKVYVGAAGRANHAGDARASGSVAAGDGNSLYIGIEWMVSGTQRIPAEMRRAAVILNAVLTEKVTQTSVQTISCHYNTSVTGKWDIGDPDGVDYKGYKVLDIVRFRQEVKAERENNVKSPKPPVSGYPIKLWHASLEASDTDAQKQQDVETIFAQAKERGVKGITGTEAGPGHDGVTRKLLTAMAGDFGFRVHTPDAPTDGWVAVRRSFISGGWKTGYTPVIPGNVSGKHSPRGVVWAEFKTPIAPRVGLATSHYLKDGRRPGDPNYKWNRDLAEEIGAWAREAGRGNGIAFYGGDQNTLDKNLDTFHGQPLTSAGDELKKWPRTGPGGGEIDLLASFDGDGRVRATKVRRYTDEQIFLHSDHKLIEANYFLRDKN